MMNKIICAFAFTTLLLTAGYLSFGQGIDVWQIAFASESDTQYERIYTMNIDGSSIQIFNYNNGDNFSPGCSPNGRYLVFISNGIKLLDAFSNSIITVPTEFLPEGLYGISVSSDGERLSFISWGNYNKLDVYVVDSDGLHLQRLTNFGLSMNPSLSPDGSKVVFASAKDEDEFEIYIINTDGTSLTRLTNRDGFDGYPSWSPDSSKIVFTSDRDDTGFNVYVMNSDGTGVNQITHFTGATAHQPKWSPDGSKIAFTSDHDGNMEIYTMNADGTEILRLTSNPSYFDSTPCWLNRGQTPTAISGPDQTVTTADGLAVAVTLDGSGSSDPDGMIVHYVWTLEGAEIATGVNPTVNLPLGTHVITLRVADDDELWAEDTVTITVQAEAEACTSPAGSPAPIGSGVSDLINAINAANANGSSPDTIVLAADATYTLTATNHSDDGANGLLSITTPVTIYGNCATIKRDSGGTGKRRGFTRLATG